MKKIGFEYTMDKIQKLLNEASRISKRHDEKEKETGYNFNLFSITNIERYEVNTHSAMVAELLNPKGSHGQGSIFLELFINTSLTLEATFKDKLDYKNAIVLKEKGFNGGDDRIDILVKFTNYWVLIENKIDAPDGIKQLERYNDIGKKECRKFDLIYLTKCGTDASQQSLGDTVKDEDYIRLSYVENISNWLSLCIKEVSLTPIVREAILQYLNLVKKITGASMTTARKAEVAELLSENHNLKIAVEIEKSIAHAKGNILFDFFESIENMAKEKGYEIVENEKIDIERVYDKEKCNKWFQQEGKRKKSIEFGVFFKTNDENTLFFVCAATKTLHYGFVPTKTDDDKYSLKHENELKTLPPDFIRRTWEGLHWYSIDYGNIHSNIENLLNIKEKDQGLNKDIFTVLDQFNNDKDKLIVNEIQS